MKKKGATINYDNAYAELEAILNKLESGEVGVDQLEPEILRAQELVEFCRTALRNSKTAIDKFEQELNKQDKG